MEIETQWQNELPVIPLWIDGHAYLTITAGFATVRRAADGLALRRIPLCAAPEIEAALRSAHAALAAWSTLPIAQRRQFLAAVGEALSGYAGHFAALIEEETGKSRIEAENEVSEASRCLRVDREAGDTDTGVLAIAGDDAQPLAGFLRLAVPAWLAGAVVIVRTPAGAPSALFALAELTARCGWPNKVFCLLHNDAGTNKALRAADNRMNLAHVLTPLPRI